MISTELQLEILELIRNRDADTVLAICDRLGITATAVRRHLDGLEAAGFATHSAARAGPGRPRHVYDLTEAGHAVLPKRYATLLTALLAEIRSLSRDQLTGLNGGELLEGLFRRIAEKANGGSDIPSDSRSRLQALQDTLSELDFAPEIEETTNGVTVTLRNCPFREAALQDRVVCEFDRILIGDILGLTPSRDACIVEGAQCCIYSLDASPT